MKNNILFSRKNLFIIFLIFFSLLVNQYYGNKGIFPVDGLAHFDAGFRILLGEYPFKNYWVVSGPFIDYLQAVFFYLFGVNWQSYVLHASIVNVILSVATFLFLINFKLNIYFSFFYSLLFSILAYPTSGTPFVDHHSAFFSLLGIYSLIIGIKHEKKIYWILLPILFSCAFLSKQVPSAYIIISAIFVLTIYSLSLKKYYWIKYSFVSFFLLIISLMVFGKFQGIAFSSFLDQYIFYPQSIGGERFNNFKFTYSGVVDHFKFIYIAIIPLLFINTKKIFSDKNYLQNKNFYYFLLLFFLTFSLIFHQLLSKNQTFIFFLIPILFAFCHTYLNFDKAHLNKFLSIVLISFCLLVTLKYHLRFNEGRKFHELEYVNFKLSVKADKIDEKLKGLNWITPVHKNISGNKSNPNDEIVLLNKIKSYLKSDNRTKMVFTNYSFFSALLEEKMFSTGRWHLLDGTDYPMKNNKYFTNYKNLFINSIKENEIKVIYIVHPLENSVIYNYLNKECFTEKEIFKVLKSYELKMCEKF